MKKSRESNKRKIAGILAVAAVLVFLAGAVMGVRYYRSVLDRIPRVQETASGVEEFQTAPETVLEIATGDSENDGNILNVLLIGQSAREGEQFAMADSMILVTVNRNTRTITLTSFLRDVYLHLPDYTDQKGEMHPGSMQRLNLCYHLGHTYGSKADAMAMLDQCLLENFGVEIDYNVEIDFAAFERFVNYMGGVEVELTEVEAAYLNEDDVYVRYEVSPGKQHLDGLAALSYARMRHAEGDGGSDIRRTNRQRTVILALMEKLEATDLRGILQLMEDMLPYVVTDMTDADITRCILEILPILPDMNIETGTCPAQSTYWGEILAVGGYDSAVIRYDEEENRRLMTALTEGA